MKLHRTTAPPTQGIFVVPLVNVLVLVFAYVTLSSSFVSYPGISVAVPYTSFALTPRHDPQLVIITSGAAPVIYFQDQRTTLRELEERLANEKREERSLIIRADGNAPHALVTTVMNLGLENGYSVAVAGRMEKRTQPQPQSQNVEANAAP